MQSWFIVPLINVWANEEKECRSDDLCRGLNNAVTQGTAERAIRSADVLAIIVDLTSATGRLDGVVKFDLGHLRDQGFFVFVIWIC